MDLSEDLPLIVSNFSHQHPRITFHLRYSPNYSPRWNACAYNASMVDAQTLSKSYIRTLRTCCPHSFFVMGRFRPPPDNALLHTASNSSRQSSMTSHHSSHSSLKNVVKSGVKAIVRPFKRARQLLSPSRTTDPDKDNTTTEEPPTDGDDSDAKSGNKSSDNPEKQLGTFVT
jgi:hypothetical protein